MITITKGDMTLRVTRGAFKDIFKAQGFIEVMPERHSETRAEVSMPSPQVTIPLESENTTESVSVQESGEPETEDLSERDLSEIPLSEMNDKQLREYANQLGVDISGITSRKAVRNKIRSVL